MKTITGFTGGGGGGFDRADWLDWKLAERFEPKGADASCAPGDSGCGSGAKNTGL